MATLNGRRITTDHSLIDSESPYLYFADGKGPHDGALTNGDAKALLGRIDALEAVVAASRGEAGYIDAGMPKTPRLDAALAALDVLDKDEQADELADGA